MVRSASATFASNTFPQDAAQPHSHPAVDVGEGRLVTVFEIAKPAPKDVVDSCDRHEQASATGSRRLFPDSLFELRQALLPRPAHPTLEVIPQKIKPTLLRRVHEPCLVRMQRQSFRFHPFTHPCQRPF